MIEQSADTVRVRHAFVLESRSGEITARCDCGWEVPLGFLVTVDRVLRETEAHIDGEVAP